MYANYYLKASEQCLQTITQKIKMEVERGKILLETNLIGTNSIFW